MHLNRPPSIQTCSCQGGPTFLAYPSTQHWQRTNARLGGERRGRAPPSPPGEEPPHRPPTELPHPRFLGGRDKSSNPSSSSPDCPWLGPACLSLFLPRASGPGLAPFRAPPPAASSWLTLSSRSSPSRSLPGSRLRDGLSSVRPAPPPSASPFRFSASTPEAEAPLPCGGDKRRATSPTNRTVIFSPVRQATASTNSEAEVSQVGGTSLATAPRGCQGN